MKQKLYLLIAIFVSLFSFGQNFSSGGINYVVTSATAPYTVAVGTHGSFSGAAVIPETVDDNGITYAVTSIVNEAFLACGGLTSIIIPNSVTSIGSSAFQGCINMTDITLSNSLTSISHYSFYYCTALTSITIPESVTSIGEASFEYCSSLTSVNIPNSVTNLEGAFMNCTGLTSITLPNSITTITGFRNCTSLTSLNIPSSVNSISPGAFEGCSGLTSIIIPSSVTSIGENAFIYCTSLTSFNIPSSITSIGSRAFRGCYGLTSVTVNWLTPLVVHNQTFFLLTLGNIILNVPSGTVAAYQAAPVWQNFNITPPPVAASYLNFDGIDDHITVSNENNFDFTNQMTVEFWMQSSTAPEQWDTFIAKGDDSWRIALTATGTVAFAGTGAFTDFYSTTSVTDGNWHHVAVSYNGSNAIIYIDGILESSIIASGNIDNSSYAVSIGENLQQTGRFYNGNLDDIRIWNVARTATEISSSKNCALHGNETNLLAYYKLNQGISGDDNSAITTITNTVPIISQATLQNFSLNGFTSNFLAEAAPVTTITYTLVQNNVSCNGLNDGSIIVTASGGQEPYTFSWSTGNTNNTISNYGPGEYNLYSITDATGCYIGVTGYGLGVGSGILEQITITQPAALGNATVTTPVTYTQGATASALTATVGANGTSLLWYTTATGGTSDITPPTPSTVSPGNTSYWVSSTNANGCESERTEIVVTVNASTTPGCWAKIESGEFHTVAIAQNGTLWAWGRNSDGQLGDGSTTNRSTPTQIGTANSWQSISCGLYYTVAIKTDGTLWSWGSNYFGQLGDGTTTNKNTPVQVGTATNWQSISGGYYHTVATKTDGTLWAWGYNIIGQLGDGTTTSRANPIQIGTATTWQSISCGDYHTVAIKTDGTLWAWGRNGDGQLGDGTTTNRNTPTQIGTAMNWQSISCGYYQSVATKTDGTLWAWGYNLYGQLGDGTSTSRNTPIQIGTATNWQSISSGATQIVAIKTDGTLWAWGRNNFGQLGDGTTTNRNTPIQIGTATSWQRISSGTFHTVAIKTDGTLWAWGRNASGQLGLGDTTDTNTPTEVTCPSVLGNESFEVSNHIKMYPNPANNIVTVEVNSLTNAKLQVLDITGKVLMNQVLNTSSNTIDVQHLPSGMYLFKVSSNEGTSTGKIIKN